MINPYQNTEDLDMGPQFTIKTAIQPDGTTKATSMGFEVTHQTQSTAVNTLQAMLIEKFETGEITPWG